MNQHEMIETSAQDGSSIDEQHFTHLYYEVGTDILAKPGAICDIVEADGLKSTLIFCNSPADADFVDIILKRRCIPAKKLIGNVPTPKVNAAVEQVKSGELCALVVTDVAAKTIDPGDFEVVINHAMHSDPEIYLQRVGVNKANPKLQKVLSLISSLDVANFHYLKKFVQFPIEKAELPQPELLAKAKVANIAKQAQKKKEVFDDGLRAFLSAINESADKEDILLYLLHNTLVVLPSMTSSSERGSSYEGREDRGDRGGDRGDRGGRDRGDRGGRDRGDRDRGDRGRRGRGRSYGDFERADDDTHDRGHGDDMALDGEERDSRNGDRPRRERRPQLPPKKDIRVYIGQGSKDGLSEDALKSLMESSEAGSSAQLKRLTVRDRYAFVDFPEETTDSIISKLEETSLPKGGKLFIRKATAINIPREAGEGADEMGDETRHSHSDEAETYSDGGEAEESF